MQAVGNALLQAKPNARVMYMTAESFVQDFVSSLQQGKVEEFKKNCRSLDLLLVDDIHLLAGKEASLVEFFIPLTRYWMNRSKLSSPRIVTLKN